MKLNDKDKRRFDELETQLNDMDLKKREGTSFGGDTSWLDGMNEQRDITRDHSRHLHILSTAFATTGNSQMAEELWRMGAELEIVADNINYLIGTKINEQVKDSMTSTAQMLSALVGGVALGGNRGMADELAPVLAPNMVRDSAEVAPKAD